jgi:hypothetical protein
MSESARRRARRASSEPPPDHSTPIRESQPAPEVAATGAPRIVDDDERVKLEEIVRRHPIDRMLLRWAAQWNSVPGSPPPPLTVDSPSPIKVPWPPSAREVARRSWLLVAHILLMADQGRTPEEISRHFSERGLLRPIRKDLAKPLVDAGLIGRILDSWMSTRGVGLSVSKRLRFAASGNVLPPASADDVLPTAEDLQRRFAEQVDRWWAGEIERPTPPVILGKPGDKPIVNGKSKPRLTAARHDIIKALLNAGDRGLTGDDLVLKSKHGGAVNTLKTLAGSDPDWGAVISLPGRPGGRYRIVHQSDGS